LAAEGSHEELLADCPLYRLLLAGPGDDAEGIDAGELGFYQNDPAGRNRDRATPARAPAAVLGPAGGEPVARPPAAVRGSATGGPAGPAPARAAPGKLRTRASGGFLARGPSSP